MLKKLNVFCFLGLLLLFMGCSTVKDFTKDNIIKPAYVWVYDEASGLYSMGIKEFKELDAYVRHQQKVLSNSIDIKLKKLIHKKDEGKVYVDAKTKFLIDSYNETLIEVTEKWSKH